MIDLVNELLTRDEQAMLAFFVPALISLVLLTLCLRGDPDPLAVLMIFVFAGIALYFAPGAFAVL